MTVDERTFAGKAQSWIDAILARRTDLPYGEARVELSGRGTRKRADLTVLKRGGRRAALAGEIKMPDQPYGRNHLDGELVDDAHTKASRRGIPYFFTWNVNKLALFKTEMPGIPYYERIVESFDVADIRDSDEVLQESARTVIQDFLEKLLDKLYRLEQGIEEAGRLPLDRLFIARLESALDEPVALTIDELEHRYASDSGLRIELDTWMRDEQGWEISDVPERARLNLERAARLSCYAVVNRLVFYEVLRRKFPALQPLVTLPFGGKREKLRAALEERFEDAVQASHDYETIFASKDFGAGLPFLPDGAAEAWKRLIAGVEGFDFTALDYDIIGQMYEHLIGPAERKKYGQFFTSPEVVDLINAFCIREANARVLDPACGGGTFLVRAYARKRALAAREKKRKTHQDLLREIFGIDIATFPAQLTTINLAVRKLSDEPNYPQVAREDFFHVMQGGALLRLPLTSGHEAGAERDVVIKEVDAVVGNPPYVRQEELTKEYKAGLAALVGREWGGGVLFSGRSDLYLYFFAHGGTLLRDGGYMGLVTSVGWLDTDYGFRLQEFFLKHFRVVAVLESQVEKWFEDARVTTAVTIVTKEPDDQRRRTNLVRFIQLRRPLSEIYSSVLKGWGSEQSETARQSDMDVIRELIEGIRENQTTEYWRARVVSQGELWDAGCQVRMGDEEGDGGEATDGGEYKAGKWGQYLRAPDVYFELLDRCGDRMVPFGELAEVKRGFTSGGDKFFCVHDITEEEIKRCATPNAFRRDLGISIEETKETRVIRDGEGGRHLVEEKFLEPEFHRLTEANRLVVTAADVQKKVINAPVAPAGLRETKLGRYIAYAERRGWISGATIASRAKARPWYDLGLPPKRDRAEMFWPMAQQYRHIVAWNRDKIPCNHNLFDVRAKSDVDSKQLWSVLNSTVVALFKHQFGRTAGIEGSLKTEVIDAKMMLVPDPRRATPGVRERLVVAATKVSRRMLRRTLPEEFELDDRRELDDAVLQLLGIADPKERVRMRDRIYGALTEQYAATRTREIVAQKDRLRSKRKGVASASDLADEIWAGEEEHLSLQEFPTDFLVERKGLKSVDLPHGRVEIGRAMMETGRHLAAGTIRVGGPDGQVIEVGSQAKGDFLAAAAECGLYGTIRVPADDRRCEEAVGEFRKYCRGLETRFKDLAAQRTRDVKKQKAIVAALTHRALAWRR